MPLSLVVAGLALGIAATPHCALMCGAPCAALTRDGARPATGFQLGRLAGYTAAGAVSASSVAALGAWSQASPAMRPFWTLFHLAFLALGLWWLATGRQPDWMLRRTAVEGPVRLPGRHRPAVRATLAGAAWVAWPCAALQGGLLLAALADGATGGALVMAAFAVGSMPGLALARTVWSGWRLWRGAAASPGGVAVLGFRIAGVGLIAVSGWAVGRGAWAQLSAWCGA